MIHKKYDQVSITLIFVTSFLISSCQPHKMDFTISKGSTSIELSPDNGGRIAQINFNGKLILAKKNDMADFYGSVWWPSPQDRWDWPPPKTINNKAYDTLKVENGYLLTSGECHQSGLRVSKKIEQMDENHIQITYQATNITDKPNKIAHWEVTRLSKNGRVIFPAGKNYDKADITDTKPTFAYPTDENPLNHLRDDSGEYFDFVIYKDDILGEGIRKLNADCKNGWSAYLYNGVIFIKAIADTPLAKIAPQEGEIQVYISADLPYVEFEQQGSYAEIAPNKYSEWTVHWLLFDFENKDTSISIINDFVNQKLEEYGLN